MGQRGSVLDDDLLPKDGFDRQIRSEIPCQLTCVRSSRVDDHLAARGVEVLGLVFDDTDTARLGAFEHCPAECDSVQATRIRHEDATQHFRAQMRPAAVDLFLVKRGARLSRVAGWRATMPPTASEPASLSLMYR